MAIVPNIVSNKLYVLSTRVYVQLQFCHKQGQIQVFSNGEKGHSLWVPAAVPTSQNLHPGLAYPLGATDYKFKGDGERG